MNKQQNIFRPAFIALTILAASIFWLTMTTALAAIQLDDTMRPSNLPSIIPVESTNSANPETAATQTLILFVGNILSQVLLFAGSATIIFLIISSAQYILAFGKDELIEKGKRGVFWSLFGLAVIMLSYAIVKGVIGIILQLDIGA